MAGVSIIVMFIVLIAGMYLYYLLIKYVERYISSLKFRRLEKQYRKCKEDCIYRCGHEDFIRKEQLLWKKEMAYANCLRLHPEKIDKGELIQKLASLNDEKLINEFLNIIFFIESKNAVDQR